MDFKDLELLLQQCFDNKNLQVVDYTAIKLLPAGENYGSIMIKIDAKIRKDKNTNEEMLQLVGKTPSRTDEPIMEWPLIFRKERFMYAELFPVYRELEVEAGIDKKDLINILPNYIGYRNSLRDNAEPDEDSVLLMENMIIKEFYNVDKQTGLDFHHARKALTSLARYHALGIVMKRKRPSFVKKAIKQAQILGVDFARADYAYANAYEMLANNPCTKKHLTVIESSLKQLKDGGTWKSRPVEPWATITHNDFWTNNILFHKDNDGNVDDVKFVDFQTYLYNSPAMDISRFLGCSINLETQTNHLQELLNLYYDVFIKTLKRMDCDASPFTKNSFDREVKTQAVHEFLRTILTHKFFVSEVIDESMSNEENVNSILKDKPSEAFLDSITWVTEVYERMKWF